MPEQAWSVVLRSVICNTCDWRYLAPVDEMPDRCPHCAAAALEVLDAEDAAFPYPYPPELVVPFSVDEDTISRRIQTFAGGIPLPPKDLSPASLSVRMQRLYLPMWLVDVDVKARWQAEVGFDYEVVSHQEHYRDGSGWDSQRVREGRVRWEPRAGRLRRRYENVTAPALERYEQIRRAVGDISADAAVAYNGGALSAATVRAPDLNPEAAWPEAVPNIHRAAAEECRRAAQADHVRRFTWDPTYAGKNWTLLLLPLYATYYLDDEGKPRRVLLNGRTGRAYGSRRGSPSRAQRVALIVGLIALVLFVLSLGAALAAFLFPPLLVIGIIGIVLSLMVGAGAFVPIIQVWTFNRREARAEEEG